MVFFVAKKKGGFGQAFYSNAKSVWEKLLFTICLNAKTLWKNFLISLRNHVIIFAKGELV